MADHSRETHKTNEKADQKRQVKPKDSQPLFEQFHEWGRGEVTIGETPFRPPLERHAASLSEARSETQRTNLLLNLQRTYGNTYVQRLLHAMAIQTRLTVGAPDDVYEQEADRVADAVTKSVMSQTQRQEEEEEVQTKSLLQRQQPVKEKRAQTKPLQQQAEEAAPNNTGMPDRLKMGLENLSGIDLSDLRVHHASDKPQHLNAVAYTQGKDIYLAHGQEEHLPHEGWHAVQQIQGRVSATNQVEGVAINDNQQLESEADEMGDKALRLAQSSGMTQKRRGSKTTSPVSVPQLVAQLNEKLTWSHETVFLAPDSSANTRTNVGVGEEVFFTGSVAGDWTATNGEPAKLDANTDYVWTAPKRKGKATIKLTAGGKKKSVKMNVIEPNNIKATIDGEHTYPDGQQGAGMDLALKFKPDNVSFGNAEWWEKPGPATNIKGYYKDSPEANLYHHPNPDWLPISEDNNNIWDEATQDSFTSPWKKGSWQWIIPNHFRVVGEGGNGKPFLTVTQTFTIEKDGTSTVNKFGQTVKRKP